MCQNCSLSLGYFIAITYQTKVNISNTSRKRAIGPPQKYQYRLDPVLMHWYRTEPSPGTKERLWYRVFYLVMKTETPFFY